MNRRSGSRARRQREFDCVVHHVKNNKERLVKRLQSQIEQFEVHQLWRGYCRSEGYGRVSFRFRKRHLTIDTQRLFLILRLARPIRVGYDAGHQCPYRNCVSCVFEQKMEANCVNSTSYRTKHVEDKDIPF